MGEIEFICDPFKYINKYWFWSEAYLIACSKKSREQEAIAVDYLEFIQKDLTVKLP